MNLQNINDNHLGAHVVIIRRKGNKNNIPPLPQRPVNKKVFNIKIPYVPNFKFEPLAFNPGEKAGIYNQYIKNYNNHIFHCVDCSRESGINNWFRL